MNAQSWVFCLVVLLLPGMFANAQDCNYLDQGNKLNRSGYCAPVTVSWEVWYTNVILPANATIEFEFNWDDGSPIEFQTPNLTDPSNNTYSFTASHIYAVNPAVQKCVYQPTVRYYVNGQRCTNSEQGQTIKVFNTDDKNSNNQLVINPEVFYICVGKDGTVTFRDESIWNCEPPDQQIQDGPNDRKRWIQWVYGTNNTDPQFIDDVLIDGVSYATFPVEGPIEITSEPIYNPIPPWNTTKPIYVNNKRIVDDWFEVELRNWNQCNPYDQGFPPIIQRAIILIVPYPDPTIKPAGPFCANSPAEKLTAATAGGIWKGTGITSQINGTFDPATAGPGVHSIIYSVTNTNGCTASDTIDITVYALPDINISSGPLTNLCPGALVQLNGNPSGGLAPYKHLWSGDTSPLSVVNIQDPDFQTTTVGTYNLNYRVTDSRGCQNSAPTSVVVSYVSIHFDQPVIDVCANTPVSLEPNPVGGSNVYTTHLWSGTRTDLLSDVNIENPVFNSPGFGTFNFNYYVKDNQGCDATASVQVTVREIPDPDAGKDSTVCGLIYQLDGVSSVGSGQWTFISGSGVINFSSANQPNSFITASDYGTYELQYKEDNFGCSDSDRVVISFVRIPHPTVMDDKSVCGLSMPLTATPDIGGNWVQTYGTGTAVFVNNASPNTNVSVDIPGIYKFAWVENNGFGCVGSDTVTVQFYPIPVANITPPDTLGCNPYFVQFNNLSVNTGSYLWNFDDGFISNQPNPSHTFENNSGSLKKFAVKLFNSNSYGCKDTLQLNIWVAPAPKAQFMPDKNKGCSPLDVNFLNQSTGTTSQHWDFGDGSATASIFEPSHTFVNTDYFVKANEVVLAVSNNYGCVDTARQYITVYPLTDIGFVANPVQGCSPLRVNFIADPGAFTYKWNFGDGQEQNGTMVTSHLYEITGSVSKSFQISLITSSVFGCVDTTMNAIVVHPSPVSAFISDISDGCSPLDVAFANHSQGAIKAWWKLSTGDVYETTASGNLNHQFVNTSYSSEFTKVKLVVENNMGCRDSSETTIQTYPDVGAAIAPADPGCSPLTAVFQNTTTGGRSFTWDYGDGHASTGYIGGNIFEYQGDVVKTFNVRMVATSVYGCSDTAFTTVDVFPTPDADFDASPAEQTMPSSTVVFTNLTVGNSWDYLWKFGDGNTSLLQHTQHTYGVSGNFTIWLKASSKDGCRDSIQKSIRILPMVPQIDYGPPAIGCPPLTVEFYNNTVDATQFLWEFGDNTSSTLVEPVHVYAKPGTYTVKLTADGPGGRAVKQDVVIEVYEMPVALFDLDPRVVTIPNDVVQFEDKSIGNIVKWDWDFGDGQLSTLQNPVHQYAEEGLYDVVLKVETDKGCPDSYKLTEAVTTKPGGTIKFPNAFTPNINGPSSGAYNFKDPSNYVFFPFTQEGVVEYKLQVFNRWGQLLFESNDINIGWDGYFKNELCQMGVYVWKARVKFSNGNTKTFVGDVTLLR
jgi:gliding motility-associated-like protein